MFPIPLLNSFLPETPTGLAKVIDLFGCENGAEFMDMLSAHSGIVVKKHFRVSFSG